MKVKIAYFDGAFLEEGHNILQHTVPTVELTFKKRRGKI